MRSVLTLAVKDLRLLARDRLGMFFIIVFPVIMGVAFGSIGASFGGKPRAKSLPVAVIDEDDSPMSRAFIESLGRADALDVLRASREEATRRVRTGKLTAFVVIPRGFGETAGVFWEEGPALQLGVDPKRSTAAGMLQGYLMQAMGELIQQRFMDPAGMRKQVRQAAAQLEASSGDLSPAQRTIVLGLLDTVDTFLGSLDEHTTALKAESGDAGVRMEIARIETVDVVVPESERGRLIKKLRSRWDISFPAAMLWGVMGCVAGFAVSIAKERGEGTFFRLRIAPITTAQILAGKALGCFLAVLGVIAFMTVLGLLLGIQLARPAWLILGGVCLALGFSGLMMLISVIGRTERAVGGAGWAIIVVLCLLGGGMVPLLFMPSFMVTLSHFSPVKWGIVALEGAIWRDFSFSEMLLPCAVLLGMGTACFVTGATILSRTETGAH